MIVLVDGSVNPQLKIGFGAYLFLSNEDPWNKSNDMIKDMIFVNRFESTSSTKVEAEILLYALKELEEKFTVKELSEEIKIYTDSQNLARLLERRDRLEKRNFKTKSGDKVLSKAYLYKEIYEFMDRLDCKFIKLPGHSKISEKSRIEKIFMYVDRAARKSLRKYIKSLNSDEIPDKK